MCAMGPIKHWQIISDLINENDLKIIAEIGVWKSHFVRGIFYRCKELEQYWAIDQWCLVGPEHGRMHKRTEQDWDDLYKYCCGLMIYYPPLRALRMKSLEAVTIFPDGYFDLVYIDASHFYEDAKEDITIWLPKVKEGGFISGHDYGSHRKSHRGVTFAVDEVLGADGLTLERDSVWYKKIETV
jgi:hypothetical protein